MFQALISDLVVWHLRAKKLVSFTICWPNFHSLDNINPRKPHKVCGCLIFASISVQMQRYPLEDFKWKYLHLQLLSSDCVIYQNLHILLYITVIKLISNIISNLKTFICLSCINLIAKYYEMFAIRPPFFRPIKWVHIILNFVHSSFYPINYVV